MQIVKKNLIKYNITLNFKSWLNANEILNTIH